MPVRTAKDELLELRNRYNNAKKNLDAAVRAGDANSAFRLRDIIANLEKTLGH